MTTTESSPTAGGSGDLSDGQVAALAHRLIAGCAEAGLSGRDVVRVGITAIARVIGDADLGAVGTDRAIGDVTSGIRQLVAAPRQTRN